MDSMQWRVEMLGGLRVVRGAETITRFPTVKTAALLAYLAYYPHRQHAREVLTDLFWPDADPLAGRSSLRVALTSLRRQFEPPGVETGSVICTDRVYVSLHTRAFRPSDVALFEQAARTGDPAAFALYRGELLPGFYDDWIQNERERLALLFEETKARTGRGAPHLVLSAPVSLPVPSPLPPVTTTPRLPLRFTQFWGREPEKARLTDLLTPTSSTPRALVTLTGPGGVGKTRLSLEAARAMATSFHGAVFFVGLADVSDARQIAERIVAQAFDLVPTREPLDHIADALADHPAALLLLDNMEQLAESGAAVVQALRNRVPHLSVLVTSRRRLALPGEQEMPLDPLPVPAPEPANALETGEAEAVYLAQVPSVQLFTDRARTARPDFQVTPRNARDVAALCRVLEGIPLALELVAARASALSPAKMRAGVEDAEARWELLSTRKTDKAARHRSLHAAISWSVELLPPALQTFWTRLAVFRGGCSGEAAQAVCGEPAALEYLTQLRERSLLVLDEQADGELRFRMLETLREFAGESLTGNETHALHAAHADYFLGLAEKSRHEIMGPKQGAWLAVFDREVDNLRAAIAFYTGDTESDSGEKGLRLVVLLRLFLPKRGLIAEGRRLLDRALSPAGAQAPTETRASALTLAGRMARQQGDFAAARRFSFEGLEIRRGLNDPGGMASSLHDLGKIHAEQGDYASARVFYAEGLAQSRLSKETGTTALLLGSLAGSAMEEGDYEAAQAGYEEALALHRERGDPGNIAVALANLGCIAVERGDEVAALRLWDESLGIDRALNRRPDIAMMLAISIPLRCRRGELNAAQSALGESLALCREIGEPRISLIALESAAELAATQNQPACALRHLAAARALRASHGIPLPPSEAPKLAALHARLEAQLSPAGVARAQQQGASQTLPDALADALETVDIFLVP